MANPTSRISELIREAGGISGWADKAHIELRKENGDTAIFNLSAFQATGDLSSDLFVHGGDVVFVPPIDMASPTVMVEGDFKRGAVITVKDEDGNQVGFGITNYDAADLVKIKGKHEKNFEKILGYSYEPEVIHRDNLVVLWCCMLQPQK